MHILKSKLDDGDKENISIATGRKAYILKLRKRGYREDKQFNINNIIRQAYLYKGSRVPMGAPGVATCTQW